MNKIYLAGAMTHYIKNNDLDSMNLWRDTIIQRLNESDINIKVFNPCNNFETNKYYGCEHFLKQNTHYVEKSDIVIFNLDNINTSSGTIYELCLSYAMNKIIICFGDKKSISFNKLGEHFKEIIASSIIFDDLEEIIDYILSMYCQ